MAYFQVIHRRVVKQIKTGYRIYEYEWDKQANDIVRTSLFSDARNEVLKIICDKIAWEQRTILYSILVRELLGLDVVLLHYPGHLATAVCFDAEDVYGDYLQINGKRYIVCDPEDSTPK